MTMTRLVYLLLATSAIGGMVAMPLAVQRLLENL
jgi:hypothetical protein